MATYAELAPIIQGTGVTKTSVENFFGNLPEPTEGAPLPSITKAKVTAVANAYLVDGFDSHGGFRKFCSATKLKKPQVLVIIKEINVLKAAWLVAQNPPEVIEESEPVTVEELVK